jgi:hypothetical protein
VVLFTVLGAGVWLHAHGGPLLAGRWQAVEQVDVAARFAVFAFAAIGG